MNKSDIPAFLGLLRNNQVCCDAIDLLKSGLVRIETLEEAKPFLLASLFSQLDRHMLIISSQPSRGRKIAEQLGAWVGGETVTYVDELEDISFSRAVPDRMSVMGRLRALTDIARSSDNNDRLLCVVSAHALAQGFPSASTFRLGRVKLFLGMEIPPSKLVEKLLSLGYRSEPLVDVPGCYSKRGDVFDVFAPSLENPLRLEFFGNTIDRMSYFDTITQRSTAVVSEAEIGLASELAPCMTGCSGDILSALSKLDFGALSESAGKRLRKDMEQVALGKLSAESLFYYRSLFCTDSLFSFMPSRCAVVLDEPDHIANEMDYITTESDKIRIERIAAGELSGSFPWQCFHWNDCLASLSKFDRIELFSQKAPSDSVTIKTRFLPVRGYSGQLYQWIEHVKELLSSGKSVVIVSHHADRLRELLEKAGVEVSVDSQVLDLPQKSGVLLIKGLMENGWSLNGDVYLYTDNELFGFVKHQRSSRKSYSSHSMLAKDFKYGCFLVHVEHGVGRYRGVKTMPTGGIKREYIVLEYGGDDRLFVPTDQIDRLDYYVGAGESAPTLNRLGSQEWIRSKEKAKESAEDIAEELLETYAARETVQGFAYSQDSLWQMELEASFPYMETADQQEAIRQVKEDMARIRPMDRLICGDVGYGKTEVALRAAFMAVQDGKQVAVLVPTTVLAQQHFTTFCQRLATFPVRVEVLSRFRSAKEQNFVIAGIEDGSVDIVIGTHRMLQKDVAFKDLGLLIVDEEQRFGVVHKEYFKSKRREVDVLTLSATPIPRTLNLSLMGVRDMSLIETPPSERLPIKTFILEYSDQAIRDAIISELNRGGQVFFVHNRVHNIESMHKRIRDLIPEARIDVGHGQMPEDCLEKVMAGFASGVIDVLLCTTIIESGLDVPNANTLIVNDADAMGLTQLYQLRGRVGRGAKTAYAYFIYDKDKELTGEAELRLQTIAQASELGAGFGIAMKDLEMRGAGNILGARQSGHINAVGFGLFSQLLAEAVEDKKLQSIAQNEGRTYKPIKRLPPPTISLHLPAHIPEDYVTDIETRLHLYRQLARASSTSQVEDVERDIKDRFGLLPEEVKNLVFTVRIKALASGAKLETVSQEGANIVLRRPFGMLFSSESMPFARRGVVFSPRQISIDLSVLKEKWREVLEAVLIMLAEKDSYST